MVKKIAWVSGVVALLGAMAWSTPVQAQHNDHYACYQVKHKLPKGQAGTVSNQVQAADSFVKCKVKFLCVPTVKNGGPAPAAPNVHYVCHQCKGNKTVATYTVTDQFVSGSVETKKLRLICNLATKS